MLRGYIRPLPRHSEASQREALERSGVSVIYVEGFQAESLTEATRALRKGDRLAVVRAFLLATPRTSSRIKPRASLFAALQAIEAKGASLYEAATDRDSATERDAILFDAIEWLSGQARGIKSAENGELGRPKQKFTDEEIDRARRVWESRRYRRVEDAGKHLPRGFSVWRCYKTFGRRNADS